MKLIPKWRRLETKLLKLGCRAERKLRNFGVNSNAIRFFIKRGSTRLEPLCCKHLLTWATKTLMMLRLDAKRLLHLFQSSLALKSWNADAVKENPRVQRQTTLRVGLVHVLQPNEDKQQKPIPRHNKTSVGYPGERHKHSQIWYPRHNLARRQLILLTLPSILPVWWWLPNSNNRSGQKEIS